jgi:hypothetical protein
LGRVLKRQGLRIDVFELRVAVGRVRAVLGFPVDLPAITIAKPGNRASLATKGTSWL